MSVFHYPSPDEMDSLLRNAHQARSSYLTSLYGMLKARLVRRLGGLRNAHVRVGTPRSIASR